MYKAECRFCRFEARSSDSTQRAFEALVEHVRVKHPGMEEDEGTHNNKMPTAKIVPLHAAERAH